MSSVVASVGYFVAMLSSSWVTPIERTRVRAFIPLFIANAVFWSLFQQIFTVLAVYSDERVDWSIVGWVAPSNWIGSGEPDWIRSLTAFRDHVEPTRQRAPTTARSSPTAWPGWGLRSCCSRRCPPPPVVRFLHLSWWASWRRRDFRTHAVADRPIGHHPARARGVPLQMMALYFFSVGLGTSMSGFLARYYPRPRVRLLRRRRFGRDRGGPDCVRALPDDQPLDGGRALISDHQ